MPIGKLRRSKAISFRGPASPSLKFKSFETLQGKPLGEMAQNEHKQEEDMAAQRPHFPVEAGLDPDMKCNVAETPVQNSRVPSATMENGFYSFANISDNTTNKKTNRYSYLSDTTACQPLAPTTGSEYYKSLTPTMKPITERHPQNHASTTMSLDTIPTAENISFQITLPTVPPSVISSRSSLSHRQRSLSMRYSSPSTMSSLGSTPTKMTTLKRSNAVRCKGGLLQFFSQYAVKTGKKLVKWKIALRKRLFKFQRRPTKNKKNNAPTTSHLKRVNGYVSNVRRSFSTQSRLALVPEIVRRTPSRRHLTASTGVKDATPASPSRNSIRRTPSSIKRAASTLSSNYQYREGSESSSQPPERSNTGNTLIPVPSQMVRSTALTSLNSIVRQPSIVVNNKVIPLSRFPGDKMQLPIREEDEEDEETNTKADDYVIDTSKRMSTLGEIQASRISSSSASIRSQHASIRSKHASISSQSSSIQSSHFDEASNSSPANDSIESDSEIECTRTAWNHFLRTVIAERIRMRLQLAKLQELALLKDDSLDILYAILRKTLDEPAEKSPPAYDSDILPENNSASGLGNGFKSSEQLSRLKEGGSRKRNTSSSTMLALPEALATVRRSITMPVGLNYI
ncbi:AaceriACR148Wp [[Ashbya] aceris (nom. inval.)]|nr:AaceriACR148Wp [[Ashbya] aceris (nom. inval.)]